MTHIFISHVEEDAEIAREIADGLEAAGYTTWYYQRDTVPGAQYLTQVGQAIDECGAIVLVVSLTTIGVAILTNKPAKDFGFAY